MSATTVAMPTKRGRRSSSWMPPAFGGPGDPPAETITLSRDDPFQSLAPAPASIGRQLDQQLDRLTQLTSELQAQVQDVAPVAPVAPARVKRTSARDAWCAVVIMGLFIAAGVAWTGTRLSAARNQVATLNQQLEQKQTAIVNYQQEIQRLRKELFEARLTIRQQTNHTATAPVP